MFQSTHPHGVRLGVAWRSVPGQLVSIHAPTRGATFFSMTLMLFAKVSIHAPTRGATVTDVESRPPDDVSIHAPTRGATRVPRNRVVPLWFQSTHPHGVRLNPPLYLIQIYSSFNPRTHTGCDKSDKGYVKRVVFQSTHPHGVRPSFQRGTTLLRGFNPRTHTGCDSVYLIVLIPKSKFQSTHPHGVRRFRTWFGEYHCYVSIHAPTRGATIQHDDLRLHYICFNPRTHTGCDVLPRVW